MGTSLEETSIYALSANHDDAQTEAALQDLIDPASGIGMNLFRLCIGTSDFSDSRSVTNDPTNNPHGWYTYQDGGPTSPFSIQHDIDLNVIHVVKLAQDVAARTNHPIKFFASAWSPPAWMKDSKVLNGGNLLQSMIPAYAAYLRQFVQAYEAQGIPIYAITTNNEHYNNTPQYPSCYFSPQQETALVDAIATEFAKYNITTKVWILDHNYAYYNQVKQTLAGLKSLGEVDSVGYHHYAGDPSNMSVSHDAYPSVGTQFTEGSVWGTAGMNEIVQDFRNWSSSYVSWVTMTTQTPTHIQGPYNAPPALSPLLLIRNNNTLTGTDPNPDYYRIPEYYLYGQFMKFIQPGAVRIGSDGGSTSTTTNVAFKNPDGTIVIVAVNQNNWDQNVRFVVDGSQFVTAIPAATVATYTLKGGLPPSTVAPVGLPILPTSISPPTGSGSFVQEWYLNIANVSLSTLRGDSRYPNSPSGANVLTTLHTNDQWTATSGTRMTGCIVPNVTGAYTFYFQANNTGEFRLSTDSTRANLPASPTAYCYIYAIDWTSRPGQISKPVNLVAGQKYYFETVQAGGAGNGESGVAWDVPGIDNGQVISGKFLSPSVEATAPAVTSALSAAGTTQVAFNYQITASNTPFVYSATGLPPGLALNANTGAITGKPTTTGTYKPTISALNEGGQGKATLVITVGANALAPAFTSPTTASGTIGAAFSYTVTATNSPTSYGASGLPKGLSISATTGVVTGTPTTAGTSNVTLSATNTYGTVTQNLALTISASSPTPTPTRRLRLRLQRLLLTPTPTPTPTPPPVPVTPAGLTGTGWNKQVDLRWTRSANATGYNVLRASSVNGTYTTIASNVTNAFYSDTAGLANGTTYYYEVSAFNASGTSAVSSPVGATTEPSGFDAWSYGDVGTVAAAGSSSYQDGTYTVAGSGRDIQGGSDAFQFVSQPLTGDGAIVARVSSVSNVGVWSKAGVMIRESLAPNAANMAIVVTPTTREGVSSQWRTATGAGTAYTQTTGLTAPYWVKLVRVGNVFTSYSSPDGVAWTLQSTQTINMASAAYAGLAVTSHSDGVLCTATFDSVSILPVDTAWLSDDLGVPAIAGFAAYSDGVLTLNGAGSDIWNTGDQFRFMYQPASGDCTITVQVTGVENSNTNSKGGVMLRESLAANSPQVDLFATPNSGVYMQARASAGASTGNVAIDYALQTPCWLRLSRVGNTVTGYTSADGSTWTALGSTTVTMATNAYLGVATTSHDASKLGTATVENLSVQP